MICPYVLLESSGSSATRSYPIISNTQKELILLHLFLSLVFSTDVA
jgi:hypothetical protein